MTSTVEFWSACSNSGDNFGDAPKAKDETNIKDRTLLFMLPSNACSIPSAARLQLDDSKKQAG
jgi:hypothetical protein